MKRGFSAGLAAILPVMVLAGAWTAYGKSGARAEGDQTVWQFNQKFQDAHARMDTTAIIGMWSETGVSLLPETAPLVGKAAVTNFIREAVSNLTGYKMLKVEMTFHDIRVSGDWASEWGIEHQVIQPPDEKPVIDHWGKIALLLHREADGNWRVQQEMWNSTPKPE
jgi:ketosteroid isomerase-like protein